ncbi:hypothetical protein [Sphingomonas sp.]|uniref:hypothetical protein n=1 Tax=Sphingomonas sp. TaxID=28214 RepID=UPI003B00FF0C
MADDPYEPWRLPWRRAAIVAVVGAAAFAGVMIASSRVYVATLRPQVQVRREDFPLPRLETGHAVTGPRRPADPGAVERAMADEARAGWGGAR